MAKKIIRELQAESRSSYDIPSFGDVEFGDSVYKFKPFTQATQDTLVDDSAIDKENLSKSQVQKAANSSIVDKDSSGSSLQATLPIRSDKMDNMQNKHDKSNKSKVYTTQEAVDKFKPIKFKNDGDTLVATFTPMDNLSASEFVFNELYKNKNDANIEPLIDGVMSDKDIAGTENENLVQKAIDRAEEDYVSKLEAEYESALEKLNTLTKELESVNIELSETKGSLGELEASLPDMEKSSEQAGYDRAMRELKDRDVRQFEIQQEDYIEMLKGEWKGVDGEINKITDKLTTIDKVLPEIVIKFVQSIIGEERKINNSLINNLIKSSLAELDDLQDVSFLVNPDDLEMVRSEYPNYHIVSDSTLPKGVAKVKTKVGEVELNIDKWAKDIETQIREQFD